MSPGLFLQPDRGLAELEDPNTKLGLNIQSAGGTFRNWAPFKGKNHIFDQVIERLARVDYPADDQCTIQYYFDVVRTLRDLAGEYRRVVDVGVYMGGSSSFLAGCIDRFDFDLDLVDINADRLQFTYERIRRTSPESVHRVRMFHGDLPTYVGRVLMPEDSGGVIVHHDGSHDFNQVVKDMSALYFVRDKLLAVIAQDINLRSRIDMMNFVDLALFAVFGTDVKYASIGSVAEAWEGRTQPDARTGCYFIPGVPEGVVIPMAANSFKYPHPDMTFAQATGVELSAPSIAVAA